jgi:transposase-like protein
MTVIPFKKRHGKWVPYSADQRQELTNQALALKAGGMKVVEIAKKIGVCYGTLQDWIYMREGRLAKNKKRKRPIEITHVVPTDDLPKAIRLVKGGATLARAAKAGHVSQATLEKALERKPVQRPKPLIPAKLPPSFF